MKISEHTIEQLYTFDEDGVTLERFNYAVGEDWLAMKTSDVFDDNCEDELNFIGDYAQIDNVIDALDSDVKNIKAQQSFIFKNEDKSIAKFSGKLIDIIVRDNRFRVVVEIRESTYLVADQCEQGHYHFNVTENLDDAIK